MTPRAAIQDAMRTHATLTAGAVAYAYGVNEADVRTELVAMGREERGMDLSSFEEIGRHATQRGPQATVGPTYILFNNEATRLLQDAENVRVLISRTKKQIAFIPDPVGHKITLRKEQASVAIVSIRKQLEIPHNHKCAVSPIDTGGVLVQL